jgi:hypothetical protein
MIDARLAAIVFTGRSPTHCSCSFTSQERHMIDRLKRLLQALAAGHSAIPLGENEHVYRQLRPK